MVQEYSILCAGTNTADWIPRQVPFMDDLSMQVAKRILSLKKKDEPWSSLAARTGLPPQQISNYKTRHQRVRVRTAAGTVGWVTDWFVLE